MASAKINTAIEPALFLFCQSFKAKPAVYIKTMIMIPHANVFNFNPSFALNSAIHFVCQILQI